MKLKHDYDSAELDWGTWRGTRMKGTCLLLVPKKREPGPRDLIFHFHGIGHTHRSGPRELRRILREWAATGKPLPLIALPSFGRFWLATHPNRRKRSGILDFLTSQGLANAEHELLRLASGTSVGRRFVTGFSMGGFNAMKVLLECGDRFDRAALVNAALPTVSPFASLRQIREYARRTGADFRKVAVAIPSTRLFFSSPAVWEHESPLRQIREHPSLRLPPTLIAAGDRDELGFFEGAENLKNTLRARRESPMQWSPLHCGGHLDVQHRRISSFLSA